VATKNERRSTREREGGRTEDGGKEVDLEGRRNLAKAKIRFARSPPPELIGLASLVEVRLSLLEPVLRGRAGEESEQTKETKGLVGWLARKRKSIAILR